MTRFLRLVALYVMILIVLAPPAQAWHESGHHLVALLAYDLLDTNEKAELLAILSQHHRFAEDFAPPRTMTDSDDIVWYQIGTSGYWPDLTRGSDDDRPTWHYQLAATLVIGEADAVNVPATPGDAPSDATLDTQSLHIAQAVQLCRRVLASKTNCPADRAVAICWLAHLVADAHQPCHAGSLYAENVFPDGDRGANDIKLRQRNNLHSLWDGLLGVKYDESAIKRRFGEIRTNVEWTAAGADAVNMDEGLNPLTWLAESREFGKSHVYTDEILDPVTAASRGFTQRVEQIELSEAYFQRAGALGRVRGSVAGFRLAAIWKAALAGNAE